MQEVAIYMIDFWEGGGTGIYIGASTDLEQRFKSHYTKLHKGTHPNPDVQYWFDELGPESVRFRPLYRTTVSTVEEICKLEESCWLVSMSLSSTEI